MEEIKKDQYLCHRIYDWSCLLKDTTPSLLDREGRERQDGSETAKDEAFSSTHTKINSLYSCFNLE